MDRLDAMAVFVAVVEGGSLAAAGRKLGYSPATVTRAVGMLEKHSACCIGQPAPCASQSAERAG